MTDRGLWVAGMGIGGNVRRLMYQSLIWAAVLRDEARRLGAPFDAEDLQGLADALVDGMRRDLELGGDLLRRKMLVDQAQAVELTLAEARDTLGDSIVLCLPSRLRHAVDFLQRYPHPA